jgi:hypothetical protein
MRVWTLLGSVALFGLGWSHAVGDAPTAKLPTDICEEALEHLIRCDPAGFEVLKTHLRRTGDPAADAVLDAIGGPRDDQQWLEFFRGQMVAAKQATKSYGEPAGFELVAVRRVGGALKRFTYLCKYQKGWVRWRFTFYKPHGRWMLLGFVFDQNEEALFSECGRDESFGDLPTARASSDVKTK